jgi:CRP-like cAMP-binding protein
MNHSLGFPAPAHARSQVHSTALLNASRVEGNVHSMALAGTQQNTLLATLSEEELRALLPDLEMVLLPAGKELFCMGDPIDYAYFPADAIISLQSTTLDGLVAEIAMVGCESVTGVSTYVGEQANYTAVVHSAGYGYRVKSSVLRAAFFTGGPLARLLMRHTSALFAHLARALAGICHGTIEQRLCCWLLERMDRSPSNELKVTQELIANMLSVRRESITSAMGGLQDEGMISCRRGTVIILDREALVSCAGDCYQAMRLSA